MNGNTAHGRGTIPLYFILGPSYHGAPVLARELNAHPSILCLGTGNPAKGEETPCSCGAPVSACPFWTKVAQGLNELGDDDGEFYRHYLPRHPVITAREGLDVWIAGALSLLANEAGPKAWKFFYEQAERFLKKHETFHAIARTEAPHKFFVDAERSNIKFMVMASMGFPVGGVIHLVRDPRGYAASMKKYYPESSAEKLAMEWAAEHTRIGRLRSFFPKIPFLTLRQEELAADMDGSLQEIAAFMGLPEKQGFAAGAEASPLKNHQIGAAPQEQGEDAALTVLDWRESLHPEDQARVMKAAGPLFSDFGYKSEILP
ncbi:MAG: sulfotransferase [Micavibrio sp.]